MEHRDVIWEAPGEARHRLGREGYLRNEHDGLTPLIQHLRNSSKVQLRLARTRHTVDKENPRLRSGDCLAYGLPDSLLI